MNTTTIQDQPAPTQNALTPVWDLVIQDMQERNQVGIQRYGTPLQPFNGRDALVDAYQEALDLAVYLRQAIVERTALDDLEQEHRMMRARNERLEAELAALIEQPPQRKPLTADDLKEPKNGQQWRVEWWNESCRMMLPSDANLDRFVAYKNGTLQFTIKKADHGIKGDA